MRYESDDERAMEYLTPDDCRQLREMRIIPPGCPEEEEYILLHPRGRTAGSGELYA